MKRIDHIVIRVDDLREGVAEFQAAGFRVFYARKSEKFNALIYLQDNSMLELVGTTPEWFKLLVRSGIPVLIHPFLNRIGNYSFKESRFLDYPIYSPNIEEMHERVRDRSTRMLSAKREKPNGVVVSFTLFGPKDLNFPFVMSDYSPERISSDETDVHPNGITGLQSIEVDFAGDLETFKAGLVEFYQIEQSKIRVNGNGFSVQTDNATINYTQADRHGIKSIVLKRTNQMLDARLSEKYSLSTVKED